MTISASEPARLGEACVCNTGDSGVSTGEAVGSSCGPCIFDCGTSFGTVVKIARTTTTAHEMDISKNGIKFDTEFRNLSVGRKGNGGAAVGNTLER